jgi:hypothetical protein
LPGDARGSAASFTLADKVYLLTGQGAGAALKDLWEYNTTVNTLTRKADFAGLARHEKPLLLQSVEKATWVPDQATVKFSIQSKIGLNYTSRYLCYGWRINKQTSNFSNHNVSLCT